MGNSELIKTIFREVLGNKEFNEEVIARYFAPSYIQHVDGKQINLQQFIQHIKVLKEKILNCKITFKTLISQGNVVFSNHEVNALLKNQQSIKTKVMAEFIIENNQIVCCDELTFLVEGDKSNSNLGSTLD